MPPDPAPLVIGTAGHVDHGKTSLVRALTGIDTDRLPEEKSRGISIELGFAHLTLPDGRVLALVDAPGHERFVRTMVAGASGYEAVLLVVAADEGVMPQTREHLAICALLGIRRGVVALTKIDRVDPELQALAADELGEALRGTALAEAPVIPCSARDGRGLPALQAALQALAAAPAAARPAAPARLATDRVFVARGFGVVATGTVSGGAFRPDDEVRAWPGGARARIRRVEVRGQARDAAPAGERAALALQGIGRAELARGEVLALDGEVLPSAAIEAEVTWLAAAPAPLAASARLTLHALTTQEEARVHLLGARGLEPGQTAFAHLRLGRPVALLPGDRFVLRGDGGGRTRTWGGGRVLRVLVSPRRRRPLRALERLRALAAAGEDEQARLELDAAGTGGLTRAELAARVGVPSARLSGTLDRLLSRQAALALDGQAGRLLGAGALARLEGAIRRALAAAAAPPAREVLRTSVPGARGLDARGFAAVIAALVRRGRLAEVDQTVRLPGQAPGNDAGNDALAARVLGALGAAGLTPAGPAELAAALGAPAPAVSAVLARAIRRGEAVPVGALVFARPAVDDLRERLRAFLAAHGVITTQQWKALVGQSRKYAIPLAAHFDAEKVTLRVGEVRRLR
ncbi:MAG TPA: selenocysteine-specific translation elongation factor [Polyangia bacterium]